MPGNEGSVSGIHGSTRKHTMFSIAGHSSGELAQNDAFERFPQKLLKFLATAEVIQNVGG